MNIGEERRLENEDRQQREEDDVRVHEPGRDTPREEGRAQSSYPIEERTRSQNRGEGGNRGLVTGDFGSGKRVSTG